MQASAAYNACMQYTLRNVPKSVDEALRRRARAQHRSLNDVLIECLQTALGLAGEPVKRRDLSALAGRWQADPECDAALDEQRRVDQDLWE